MTKAVGHYDNHRIENHFDAKNAAGFNWITAQMIMAAKTSSWNGPISDSWKHDEGVRVM